MIISKYNFHIVGLLNSLQPWLWILQNLNWVKGKLKDLAPINWTSLLRVLSVSMWMYLNTYKYINLECTNWVYNIQITLVFALYVCIYDFVNNLLPYTILHFVRRPSPVTGLFGFFAPPRFASTWNMMLEKFDSRAPLSRGTIAVASNHEYMGFSSQMHPRVRQKFAQRKSMKIFWILNSNKHPSRDAVFPGNGRR